MSWAFVAACTVLAYTGFLRLVVTTAQTALPLRLAIHALTVASTTAAFAVLAWDYVPQWPDLALSASMAALQTATTHLWRHGVPRG